MTSPVRAEAKVVSPARMARRPVKLTLAFQLRAVLPVLLYAALLIVLTLVFMWLPMQREIAADPSPVVKALLSAQLFRVEIWLATFLCIGAGVAAVYALLRARHLAAPVHDVRDHLAKLALGNTEPLALRSGDEFRELEAPFNAVASRFDHVTRSNLELLRLLRRNLDGILQRSLNHGLSDKELQESVAALMRDIDAEMKKLQMKA